VADSFHLRARFFAVPGTGTAPLRRAAFCDRSDTHGVRAWHRVDEADTPKGNGPRNPNPG
jgi:hypothetical protein